MTDDSDDDQEPDVDQDGFMLLGSLNLPRLEGTERQIDYANDLRLQFLSAIKLSDDGSRYVLRTTSGNTHALTPLELTLLIKLRGTGDWIELCKEGLD